MSLLPQGFPQAPEPLAGPVIDNHTHLDLTREGEEPWDAAAAIAAAAAVNVVGMVQIGCDLPAARWTAQAVRQHPQLLGGVALHPTEAVAIHAARGRTGLAEAWGEIENLTSDERIRVVGETGLDYYWVADSDGRAVQQESFRWHIDLAKRANKVLQVHDRDAHADVMRILCEEGAPPRTVLHCFSGDVTMARESADQGWYISIAGPVTFRNGAALREVVQAVGLERLLVETDAPYLAPHPHRGKRNASYLIPLTVRAIAETLPLPEPEVCQQLLATTNGLYGQWEQESTQEVKADGS